MCRFTCGVAPTFSLDLHVLGTPLAFALSQDQTLRLKEVCFKCKGFNRVVHARYLIFKEQFLFYYHIASCAFCQESDRRVISKRGSLHYDKKREACQGIFRQFLKILKTFLKMRIFPGQKCKIYHKYHLWQVLCRRVFLMIATFGASCQSNVSGTASVHKYNFFKFPWADLDGRRVR